MDTTHDCVSRAEHERLAAEFQELRAALRLIAQARWDEALLLLRPCHLHLVGGEAS